MNILIIEDEILIQLSLKKLFERRGHHVIATPSGLNAVDLIRENHFDRVICDLMLTDITGFDVLEEFKNIRGVDELKSRVVIITAYNSQQILDQAKLYDIPIFIKPFNNLNEMIHEIERK